jgi:nitrogenase molybdenum-iron protein NifN
VEAFDSLGDSVGTLVIGPSVFGAADVLRDRIGLPDERFDHIMGLQATDRLITVLQAWSGRPVPQRFTRRRSQLQDAMLDTHFTIGQSRIAIAADSDLLHAFSDLVHSMGGQVVAAVAPSAAPVLRRVKTATVQIGDLEDLENTARASRAELLIGNSHAVASASRLEVPLMRAGFPQYDQVGGYTRTWCGYHATRQTLFDLANLLITHRHHALPPFRSVYSQKGFVGNVDCDPGVSSHVA